MSKNRILAFPIIFFLFLLQNTFSLAFSPQFPSLILMGVIFYALSEGALFGFVIGCFAGIFFEIFGIGKIGAEMMTLGLIGASSGFVASKIFRDSWLAQIALPAIGAYVLILTNLIIAKSSTQEDIGLFVLFEAFLFSNIFLTALLSPIVFSFLKKMTQLHPISSRRRY